MEVNKKTSAVRRTSLDDNSIMPYGKYKGCQLKDVPASYLLWLGGQEYCKGEIKQYIDDNTDVLDKESKETVKRGGLQDDLDIVFKDPYITDDSLD